MDATWLIAAMGCSHVSTPRILPYVDTGDDDEVCGDGLDNDCDGMTDEGCGGTDTGMADDSTDDPGDEEDKIVGGFTSGCGCHATGRPAAGLLLLASLMGVAARRFGMRFERQAR